MDNSKMMTQLGARLIDADKVNFTDVLKVDVLNNVQKEFAFMIHPFYLTELEHIKTSLTCTGGSSALSNLTYSVLNGTKGVLQVQITGGDFCTKIDYKDFKKTENTYLAGSVQNPLFHVYTNTLFVDNGQTNPVVDVFYRKIPTDIIHRIEINEDTQAAANTKFVADASQGLSTTDDIYNDALIYSMMQQSWHVVSDYDATGNAGGEQHFTVSPAAPSNWGDDAIFFKTHSFDNLTLTDSTATVTPTCELNISLHNIILDLAEAECWAMEAKADRVDLATKKAYDKIQILNNMVIQPTGIGTEGSEGQR